MFDENDDRWRDELYRTEPERLRMSIGIARDDPRGLNGLFARDAQAACRFSSVFQV